MDPDPESRDLPPAAFANLQDAFGSLFDYPTPPTSHPRPPPRRRNNEHHCLRKSREILDGGQTSL